MNLSVWLINRCSPSTDLCDDVTHQQVLAINRPRWWRCLQCLCTCVRSSSTLGSSVLLQQDSSPWRRQQPWDAAVPRGRPGTEAASLHHPPHPSPYPQHTHHTLDYCNALISTCGLYTPCLKKDRNHFCCHVSMHILIQRYKNYKYSRCTFDKCALVISMAWTQLIPIWLSKIEQHVTTSRLTINVQMWTIARKISRVV